MQYMHQTKTEVFSLSKNIFLSKKKKETTQVTFELNINILTFKGDNLPTAFEIN